MQPRLVVHVPDAITPDRDAEQTIAFSVDGLDYEIALTDDHAARLRSTIGFWIARAHPVGGALRRDNSKPGSTAAIRSWAIRRGHPIAERGALPATVVAAYVAEHAGTPVAY